MADSQNKQMLRELQGHNIIKRAKDEGEVTQIGNLQLLWKVRGPETGYQFSIYEMELQPKVGIPLHKHPYAEFFRVLEGEVSFAKLDEKGEVEWIVCGVGDSVNAPPNAPHTFLNRSSAPARFMSVSTYYHEAMFLAGIDAMQAAQSTSSNDPAVAFGSFVKAAEELQVFTVDA